MGNARARPAGFNDLTTLLGSEMDTIDIGMSRAPNEVTGSNGVVAAPATALLWGGAGVTVSGQFTASSTTTLSGTTTIASATSITATTALNGYEKTNTILGTGVSVAVSPLTSRFHYYTAPADGTKYYIDDAGTSNGDSVDLVFYDIALGESVDVWSLPPPAGTSRINFGEGYGWARMRKIAGAWRLVGHSGSNALIGVP